MISILMQSSNQKCNALESVFGIFLHSTNTPEKVINALAHMGISISVNSIHGAVHSLSNETTETLRSMGQTLLVSYAYDNFDIDFKRSVPTVETTADTLEHLTSGTLIMLEHGVKTDDLKCSEELWEKSHLNPKIDPKSLPTPQTCKDLEELHPELDHSSGLTQRKRFNAWQFRHDLIHNGPPHFGQFLSKLGQPEAVEQIPIVKMCQAPARSMDINQSKVSGNISAIPDLLKQGGIEDPTEKAAGKSGIKNISKYVVIFFGDLGTFKRVQSLLIRRSLEETFWRRYQYVVFGMGLFHLKMACVDAIWRIFINPLNSRQDPNSLIKFTHQHRPKETGKITKGPQFRQMHEVIVHNGLALRLDCWRELAAK